MEKAANINDVTCKDGCEIPLKTKELLSETQLLMKDIQELLDRRTFPGPSNQRSNRTQECQVSVEMDEETLVIEGFPFLNATNREDLRRLSSQTDEGICKRDK